MSSIRAETRTPKNSQSSILSQKNLMYFIRAILYNVTENLKFSSNLICFVIIQSFYNGLYYLYLNII